MTAQNPPIFLQAGSHPAEDVRRELLSRLILPQHAMLTTTDLAVSQAGTPNMSVDVAGGRAYIVGSEATYQGAYFVENRGTTNLAIAAADATNPRRDLIVAKVQDSAYSGATDAWSLAVVTGTPAASPSDPAAPANAFVLARVAVAAGATSITNANITDLRTSATSGLLAAPGGQLVRTSTTRPTTGLYPGLQVYETDTGRRRVYSGSGWIPATSLFVGTKASQLISNATETEVTWSDDSDPDGWHAGSSANIVVPAGWAGIVEAEATITWPNDVDGYRYLRWNVAGSDMPAVRVVNAGGLDTGQQVSLTTAVSGGETIKLRAVHTAGNALTVSAGRVTVKFTSFA